MGLAVADGEASDDGPIDGAAAMVAPAVDVASDVEATLVQPASTRTAMTAMAMTMRQRNLRELDAISPSSDNRDPTGSWPMRRRSSLERCATPRLAAFPRASALGATASDAIEALGGRDAARSGRRVDRRACASADVAADGNDPGRHAAAEPRNGIAQVIGERGRQAGFGDGLHPRQLRQKFAHSVRAAADRGPSSML